MAATSAKTLTVDNPKPAKIWTIFSSKLRKQRREVKLMQKMQSCMEKLESSNFFRNFLNQMQSVEMASYFRKVMEMEPECKMPVVIYGIGSIESSEYPRWQLSLALLLKKNFSWIGDMEVFDPIISSTESRILMDLGCSVLSINEQGRRQVSKPTLFFMPYCDADLYDNLLQANWKTDSLNKIVVFGNSFEDYERIRERIRKICKKPKAYSCYADSQKHIAAITKFTKEFAVDTDNYIQAFAGLKWHFFSVDSEIQLDQQNPCEEKNVPKSRFPSSEKVLCGDQGVCIIL